VLIETSAAQSAAAAGEAQPLRHLRSENKEACHTCCFDFVQQERLHSCRWRVTGQPCSRWRASRVCIVTTSPAANAVVCICFHATLARPQSPSACSVQCTQVWPPCDAEPAGWSILHQQGHALAVLFTYTTYTMVQGFLRVLILCLLGFCCIV
jgi:hypothetical protein